MCAENPLVSCGLRLRRFVLRDACCYCVCLRQPRQNAVHDIQGKTSGNPITKILKLNFIEKI